MASFRSFQSFADESLCLDFLLNYITETEISTKEIILRQQNYLRTTAVIIKTESINLIARHFQILMYPGLSLAATIDCICLQNYC